MKKILVSGCLFGWHCRYDAVDIPCEDPIFLQWKEEGRLIPVCPEVFGGLPTPRPDSQRIGAKVMTCAGVDVTEEYEKGGVESVRLARENDVAFAIMAADSPSCGSKEIYDGTFTGIKIAGQGRAVQLLREAGVIVFDQHAIAAAKAFLDAEEAGRTGD